MMASLGTSAGQHMLLFGSWGTGMLRQWPWRRAAVLQPRRWLASGLVTVLPRQVRDCARSNESASSGLRGDETQAGEPDRASLSHTQWFAPAGREYRYCLGNVSG